MSNVSEVAEVMSVRLLKWNEKLDNNIHRRYRDRGFFLFYINNEFTVNDCYVAHGATDVVMLFDFTSLESPHQIESMVMKTLVLLTVQLRSETIKKLGIQISNYLNSNHFDFQSILASSRYRSANPMSVIVVEICRTRNIVYDQKIMGDAATLFPPQSHDQRSHDEYRKLDTENQNIALSIRLAIGVSDTCLTAVIPIAEAEPRILVEVSAVVALQTIGWIGNCVKLDSDGCEMMDEVDSCPICLKEYSCRDLIVKTPCFHIFHGYCLTRWLSKMRHCPICRFKFT